MRFVDILLLKNYSYVMALSLIFCKHVQTIVQTKENIEKKQALTYEEMEAEREEVIFLFLSDLPLLYQFCSYLVNSILGKTGAIHGTFVQGKKKY